MKIFITKLNGNYLENIAAGFRFLGDSGKIPPGARVAIKPNLTFPVFRPGVMTNPAAVQGLIEYVKNFTEHVIICESDSGGYNRFSMDEVFTATGLADMAKHYGIQVVNMSNVQSRPVECRSGLRKLSVPLPKFLLDDTDLFITVPVPKVHCNTIVSIALKNQWGVIQQPESRLRLHPYFKEVIYQINKALPRTVAVVDGMYGLTRNGPLRGNALELDWLMVGDNIFAVDYAVVVLMGYDYRRIPYLKYVLRKEGITRIAQITFNRDYKDFQNHGFYLEREWTDYPGVLTFNSRVLAYVGYESVLAKPLHWLLYKFREPFY